MPRSLRLIVFAIAVQVSATGAAAEPIRVTGGSLAFDTGDPPTFSLLTSSGQLFEAEGKGRPLLRSREDGLRRMITSYELAAAGRRILA